MKRGLFITTNVCTQDAEGKIHCESLEIKTPTTIFLTGDDVCLPEEEVRALQVAAIYQLAAVYNCGCNSNVYECGIEGFKKFVAETAKDMEDNFDNILPQVI